MFDWDKISKMYPKDILEWLEWFCYELDAEKPDPKNFKDYDLNQYFERLGAWETQKLIREKLLYAISVEKNRLDKSNIKQ